MVFELEKKGSVLLHDDVISHILIQNYSSDNRIPVFTGMAD